MKKFSNQRILFFSPVFFGYENSIKENLSSMFMECVFYDERAKPTTLEKILIRLNCRNLISKKIETYYHSIINQYTANYFDYIVFFNPETITASLLSELREKQKKAKFILYMWDSFCNKPHTKELLPFFDKSLSFNRDDSVNYNMKFRPLFFIDEYNDDYIDNATECDIDICFIGTIHSDRYKILKQVERWAIENNLKTYFYMYFPSWILYLKYKIQNYGKISVNKKDFKFTPIKSLEVINYLSRSKVIIDIQHPKQTGLTMRTIEMLGMRKKLITTNFDIKTYDFYNKNNIEIIDRNNVSINKDFIYKDFDRSVDEARKMYSIESFLREILEDK